MRRLTRLIGALTLGAAVTATALHAQSAGDTTTGSVAGSWRLALQGGDHVVPMGLELEQNGRALTGTLMAQGKEVPLAGEITNGAFRLTPTVKAEVEDRSGHGHSGPLEITGKLLEDGTMSGEFSSPKGGIPWTAERLKKRK